MVKKFKTMYEKIIMKQMKEQLLKERPDEIAVFVYGILFLLIFTGLFILVYVAK